jgi:alkylhydroperoxidase/carboxymuconolactone decarboxylase family protein
MGKFSKDLMEKFFDYYNSAVGKDGALSKREKALIALAVSHVKQCPYCIDAYTTECLESGADPEQMTEAIHVAASMKAGITLIHGIQMHNALERNGAL